MRGSRLVLEGVGVNWTRAGLLRILERMGAIVLGELEPVGEFAAGEPVADLDVSSAPIEGTVVEPHEVPLAIDELPLVALLGCFAEGETIVRGAAELRVKESDRIATVVDGLRGLGADIEAAPDGFLVRGTGGLRGGRIDAHGDHRLALLGAVAGLASREGVEVVGMDAAAVSYPGFVDDVAALRSGVAMVVAIDGPAGAGKSTVARAVADALGFTYLDSGAMYRAVALAAIEQRREPEEVAPSLRIELGERVMLNGRDVTDAIRTPEVSEAASRAAAEPVVREAMVAEQRRLLAQGDWVAEGRDIGTVVAPDAEVKVFLTADAAERARRRAAELGADPARVLAEQTIRDERDRTREHSPLAAADGAVVLDTTELTLAQVVERVVKLVRSARR